MPTVSLDTVHRTLWLLSDLGLVTTLGPRGESVRFDANLENRHHYACVRCGLTRDFDSPELSALRIPSAAKAFGNVTSTRVEVRGLCAACAKATAPRSRYARVMNDEQRTHLVDNLVAHLGNAQKRLQLRQTALFYKANPDWGERVAKGLELKVDEVKRLAAMPQADRVKATQR